LGRGAKGAFPFLGKGARSVSKGLMGMGITGGAKILGKTGAKLGGKALAKSIPIIGTIASVAFAANSLFGIGKTLLAGEKVRGSQYARLAGDVAGIVPGIGAVGVAGDIAAAALEIKEAKEDAAKLAGGANPFDNQVPANTAAQTAEPLPGQMNAGAGTAAAGGGGTPTSSKIVNDSQGSWLEQMFTTRISLAPAFAHANNLSAKNAYS